MHIFPPLQHCHMKCPPLYCTQMEGRDGTDIGQQQDRKHRLVRMMLGYMAATSKW